MTTTLTRKPCALCTGFELVFAALDRDRASAGPRIHLERVRRITEDARKTHALEHHQQTIHPALEEHNRDHARYLVNLATEINDYVANAAKGRNAS